MKIELNLDFNIPIYRFFYGTKYTIPQQFELNGRTYKNYICILYLAWDAESQFESGDRNYLNENDIIKHYSTNHIICFPTQKGVDLCNQLRPRLNCCLASHNSFIDESLYTIDLTCEIKYNMIVSSAFAKYKNLHVLTDVNNVIGIGYNRDAPGYGEYHPTNVKILNFTDKDNIDVEKERISENYRHLHPTEIIKYINSSKIGGMFSRIEGSCYSSGEYLLCGIPCLTCQCQGGRETFYNSNNSVICELTKESVAEKLEYMLTNYDKFDRNQIREDHIKIMEIQRDNLTN
jgi:glycosyltransferase involved in cell wall biosynthesis